jgi:hypothetical protein
MGGHPPEIATPNHTNSRGGSRLKLSVKSVVYTGDVGLLQWTATSTAGRVNDGVDTYVLEEGAIKFETATFTVEPA